MKVHSNWLFSWREGVTGSLYFHNERLDYRYMRLKFWFWRNVYNIQRRFK